MEKNIGTRFFVGVALICALGAFGCRSGWKFGNPFSKAPKASSVETPSELDELDLTPPPENYTTSDRSKKDANEESLAQNGKYEAPEKKQTEANESQALVADARRAAENATSPNDNFRAPNYSQDYQTAQNYNGSQSSPSYRETQSYQATAYDSPASENFGSNSPQTVAQNSTQNNAYQQQTLNVAQNNYSNGVPNGIQNGTYPTSAASNAPSNADYSTLNVVSPNAQVATAPTTATPFPSLDSSTIAPYNTTADAATYPTSYPTTTPTSDATRQPAYVAQNVPNDSAYRTAPVSNAPFPTSDAFLDAPENAASASQTAPTSDAYSNVYYQQQTTSGGFAPGSVGLY